MKNGFRIAAIVVAFFLAASGVWRWQTGIQNGKGPSLVEGERLDAATGLCFEEARLFFYFYYYLDLLPVTSSVNPTTFSREGAKTFVREFGRSLANDLNKPCSLGRAGDWGKFLLLLPSAWESRNAIAPSTVRATSFLFKLSLVGVLAAAFLTRRYALGLLLVILIGSYRFQIYEAHFRNNVFSISITTCLFLLALNFRFLCRNASKQVTGDLALAALSGIVLACSGVVRGDSLPMSLSVLAVYILSGQRIRRILALSTVFLTSLLITTKSFEIYFNHKVAEAHKFVRDAGGTIRAGTTLAHHPVWHPIAAGLGDFGTNRGFVWDDTIIFKNALPLINQKYNRKFEWKGYFYVEPGMAEHEWVKPEAMPEYVEVVREMVISTIMNDPWWYVEVLKKRWQKLEYTFSTVRITSATDSYPFPLSKWIFCPILIACVLARRLDRLKLVAFSLPTCFVPLFITTIQGSANYAISHLVAAAVGVESCLFIAYWLYLKATAPRTLPNLAPSSEGTTGASAKGLRRFFNLSRGVTSCPQPIACAQGDISGTKSAPPRILPIKSEVP